MSPDLLFKTEEKLSSANLVGHRHNKNEVTQLSNQEVRKNNAECTSKSALHTLVHKLFTKSLQRMQMENAA